MNTRNDCHNDSLDFGDIDWKTIAKLSAIATIDKLKPRHNLERGWKLRQRDKSSFISYPVIGGFSTTNSGGLILAEEMFVSGNYDNIVHPWGFTYFIEALQSRDQDLIVNFQIEGKGREVTIYQESADTLVCTVGIPGEKPELEYRGPILAQVTAVATSWGESVKSLAALSSALTDAGSRWTTWETDPDNIIAEAVTRASHSRESHGFICVSAATGVVSQSVYIFRTAGWEYAISFAEGSFGDVLAAELDDYRSYSLTCLSPDGKMYRRR